MAELDKCWPNSNLLHEDIGFGNTEFWNHCNKIEKKINYRPPGILHGPALGSLPFWLCAQWAGCSRAFLSRKVLTLFFASFTMLHIGFSVGWDQTPIVTNYLAYNWWSVLFKSPDRVNIMADQCIFCISTKSMCEFSWSPISWHFRLHEIVK